LVNNIEKALKKVYDMSPTDRTKMGAKAIKFVKENLTWNKLGEKINQSIDKI
jgi:hypothetical protein